MNKPKNLHPLGMSERRWPANHSVNARWSVLFSLTVGSVSFWLSSFRGSHRLTTIDASAGDRRCQREEVDWQSTGPLSGRVQKARRDDLFLSKYCLCFLTSSVAVVANILKIEYPVKVSGTRGGESKNTDKPVGRTM